MATTIGDLLLTIRAQMEGQQQTAQGLQQLSTQVQKSAQNTEKLNQTLDKLNQTLEKSSAKARKFNKANKNMSERMTDLAKSVQVALGPLSGVASRITAITSLANRNTAAIAGVIGVLIGFGAIMLKSSRAGMEYELSLKSLENRVRAMGGTFHSTAQELDQFARFLGRQTLTNANEARKGMLAMMQATKLSREEFKLAMLAAQGLVETGYGTLINNARTLARVLEEPGQSLESLRRFGVQLNKAEQLLVRTLSRTNRQFEARSLILDKLRPIMENAGRSSGTMAGAIDELNESITEFFERSSVGTGVVAELTAAVNALKNQFDTLAQGRTVNALGLAMRVVATAARGLAENLDLVAGAILGVISAFVIWAFIKSLTVLATALWAAGKALMALRGGFILLAAAMKKSVIVIGAAIAGIALAFGMRAEQMKEAMKSVMGVLDELFGDLTDKSEEAKKIDLFPVAFEFTTQALKKLRDEQSRTLVGLVSGNRLVTQSTQQAINHFLELQQRISREAEQEVEFISINQFTGKVEFLDERVTGLFDNFLEKAKTINSLKIAKASMDKFQTELEESKLKTEELTEAYKAVDRILVESAEKERVLTGVRRALIAESVGLAGALVREASAMGDAFEDAFERAIFDGGRFMDILRDLERELLRIILRSAILEPLGGAIAQTITGFGVSIFGGAAAGAVGGTAATAMPTAMPGGGMLQHGGPFLPNRPIIVGEAGPELLIPRTAGNVVPNDQIVGGTTIVNNFYVTTPTGNIAAKSQQQVAALAGIAVQRALRRNS